MNKKILIMMAMMIIVPAAEMATGVNKSSDMENDGVDKVYVTTNCDKIPVQESYNSPKVIGHIQNKDTKLEKVFAIGEFYGIKTDEIEGYINRAYTVEGAKEKETQLANRGMLTGGSTMAQVANERKRYVRDNKYTYSQSGPVVPANYKRNRVTDCSAFVCDVIYNYGKIRGSSSLMNIGRKSSSYFNEVGRSLKRGNKSKNFILVPSTSQARAGDILCYDGHVEIYAGKSSGSRPMVWSCGTTNAIRNKNLITRASRSTSRITYILRVKG